MVQQSLVFVKKYSNTSALGVTAPTKHYHPAISDSDKENFGPFNSLTVYNFSEINVELRYESEGSTEIEIIPKNSIFELKPENQKAFFNQPIITNPSSTYSIGIAEITVIVRKAGVYGQHIKF